MIKKKNTCEENTMPQGQSQHSGTINLFLLILSALTSSTDPFLNISISFLPLLKCPYPRPKFPSTCRLFFLFWSAF